MNIKTLKQMTKQVYRKCTHTKPTIKKLYKRKWRETENTLRAEQMIKDQLPFQ